MLKKSALITLFCIFLFPLNLNKAVAKVVDTKPVTWWDFQSIDTMKWSRDRAKEKLDDPSFDAEIDKQIEGIALVGATHVAIATPYDAQFVPFLTRWVNSARAHGLKVWFRGNFSGWEGWFGYSKIGREEHQKLLKDFILKNPGLFESGDVFTPCPECENGGPGDPRLTGDVQGHRDFLISEFRLSESAFRQIKKDVKTGFFSMNGDVARLVMDRTTTHELGGIVTIDHYVKTPEKLASDIQEIANSSGGLVVLGEFGAPIPDIHGNFTQKQQEEWVAEALKAISTLPDLIGVSYWTNIGGSTAIWDDSSHPRQAVLSISRYFKPNYISGRVINEAKMPIKGAKISVNGQELTTDKDGTFLIKTVENTNQTTFEASGYETKQTFMQINSRDNTVTLKKTHESVFFKIQKFFSNLF